MGRISSFLDNPQYFITSPASKGWLNWMPDKTYLKLVYRLVFHKKCDLKNPIGFNEKIQWLKIYDRKPIYTRLVDKYDVRGFIAEEIGEEYLIPCLGLYDSVDDIDIATLPDQFVLKCTHDSGSVEICRDKKTFDFETVKKHLCQAMKRNYYITYREWAYKDVSPRIIAEKYMIDVKSDDLQDYKVLCFNGSAKIIIHHENRYIDGKEHYQTFYDREWKRLDLGQTLYKPNPVSSNKPELLEEMLRLSEKISRDIKHARIDWYIINDRLYFGEITLYCSSGYLPFETWEMDKEVGAMLEL